MPLKKKRSGGWGGLADSGCAGKWDFSDSSPLSYQKWSVEISPSV